MIPTDWGQFLSPEKLARIGPAAVPALITALSTPVNSCTFYDAVEALGEIGSPAADVAVPALISALSDAEGGVREEIARALAELVLLLRRQQFETRNTRTAGLFHVVCVRYFVCSSPCWSKKYHETIGDLSTDPDYSQFMASPACERWKKTRKRVAERPNDSANTGGGVSAGK